MRWPCISGRADPLLISTVHTATPPQSTISQCRDNVSIHEWDDANQNTRWLYLFFFNGLWVVFPVWILYEAYAAMSSAMSQTEMVDLVNYLKKDD